MCLSSGSSASSTGKETPQHDMTASPVVCIIFPHIGQT